MLWLALALAALTVVHAEDDFFGEAVRTLRDRDTNMEQLYEAAAGRGSLAGTLSPIICAAFAG